MRFLVDPPRKVWISVRQSVRRRLGQLGVLEEKEAGTAAVQVQDPVGDIFTLTSPQLFPTWLSLKHFSLVRLQDHLTSTRRMFPHDRLPSVLSSLVICMKQQRNRKLPPGRRQGLLWPGCCGAVIRNHQDFLHDWLTGWFWGWTTNCSSNQLPFSNRVPWITGEKKHPLGVLCSSFKNFRWSYKRLAI